MTLRPGDVVVDAILGPAKVVRETRKGYLIALEKPAGLKVDRPRDVLGWPDGSSVESTPPLPNLRTEPGEQAGDHQFRSRRAIDALRYGVVPASDLAALTLRHEELIAWAGGAVARPGSLPRASAVFGPFGSGKSHAMAAIRQFARAQGYLTMATEINGVEISLSQPRDLLASLLSHMADSDLDGAAPLAALVARALDGNPHAPAGGRAVSLSNTINTTGRLMETKQFSDVEELVERLLGSDVGLTKGDFKSAVRATLDWSDYVPLTYDTRYNPTPLVRYTPVDLRPQDFAHALIGYASIARSAGFEGLVVTVDELEVEDAMYTAAKWQKLLQFVGAMQAELGGGEAISGGLSLFLAAVGGGREVKDQVVDLIVDATDGARYELQPWGDADLMLLSQRIHEIYLAAYGADHSYDRALAVAAFDLIDRLELEETGRIRSFIRAYVHHLDLEYGPPFQ